MTGTGFGDKEKGFDRYSSPGIRLLSKYGWYMEEAFIKNHIKIFIKTIPIHGKQ
jgi:hypothetical protein